MHMYDLKGFSIAGKKLYYVHELYMHVYSLHCANHIPVHLVHALIPLLFGLLNTDYTVAPAIDANSVMEMHTCTDTFCTVCRC